MGLSYANLLEGFIEYQFFSQYHGPNLNSTAVTLTIASVLLLGCKQVETSDKRNRK